MTKNWTFCVLVTALMAGAIPAQASKYQVGRCLPNITSFSTIQAAVSSVPAFSTILVCPGIYQETVTISQPLTLRGQGFPTVDRAVIEIPPNGERRVNVSDILGIPFIAQVLVQNVVPAGSVNLINLTVDGTGGGDACTASKGLAGVFFASGTSGSITGLTLRNQVDGGCGAGVWVENGAGPVQSIVIGNDSVHDMDGAGIVALSDQNPPTLTATIETSSVNGNNNTQGILTESVGGKVTNNIVTGGALGIVDVELSPGTPGITISGNTVADILDGGGLGIALREGDTASSNKVSNALTAFYLQSGGSGTQTLTGNTVKNIGTTGIEFNCVAGATLKTNSINDAAVAFDKVPAGTNLSTTPIYNVDLIQTGTCP